MVYTADDYIYVHGIWLVSSAGREVVISVGAVSSVS